MRITYIEDVRGFELPADKYVQWIVRRGADDLLEGVNLFFQQMRESGRMGEGG